MHLNIVIYAMVTYRVITAKMNARAEKENKMGLLYE